MAYTEAAPAHRSERLGYPGTLIRWGAVFAGAIVGYAVMLLLSTLWIAFANDAETGTGAFAGYLNWWIGGSAIFAIFLGAFLAGMLTNVRGIASGFMHGLTVWGLVMFASVFIEIPGFEAAGIASQTTWTLFWTFLVGLGTAVVGGVFGGGMPQPAGMHNDVLDVRDGQRETATRRERVAVER